MPFDLVEEGDYIGFNCSNCKKTLFAQFIGVSDLANGINIPPVTTENMLKHQKSCDSTAKEIPVLHTDPI